MNQKWVLSEVSKVASTPEFQLFITVKWVKSTLNINSNYHMFKQYRTLDLGEFHWLNVTWVQIVRPRWKAAPRQKLNQFVAQYELFYGKCAMTTNLHCLGHSVNCVKSLGPLWCFSMFTFESFNETLKKWGDSSNNVINQVIENITLNSGTSMRRRNCCTK